MRPGVIGIAGPARAGKDTITNFIIAMAGGYQYMMAGPLKRMMAAGLGIDMSDPYWIEHKEKVIPALGKSPRQMMQTLGTEWGRQMVHEDLWVILAKQHLANAGPGMIISDVRFDNEVEFVREHGRLIHVRRQAATAVAAHASEGGVPFDDTQDVLILNDGTLEDLRTTLRGLMESWGLLHDRREGTIV